MEKRNASDGGLREREAAATDHVGFTAGYAQCLRDIAEVDRTGRLTDVLAWLVGHMADPDTWAQRAYEQDEASR
jgi:hypothetical protein